MEDPTLWKPKWTQVVGSDYRLSLSGLSGLRFLNRGCEEMSYPLPLWTKGYLRLKFALRKSVLR